MAWFKYTVDSDSLDDAYDTDSAWDEEFPESMAVAAARDYHRNHYGAEASWPVEITLYRMDDRMIGRFVVDREYEPEFWARALRPASPAEEEA